MRSRSTYIAALVAALVASTSGLHAGCKSKKKKQESETRTRKAPDLSGLEAVPGEVSALVGLNVGALRDSWLVQRMVEQMFRRDPELETRIESLMKSCSVDVKTDIQSVIIGLTRGSTPESGDGHAVMVVAGSFVEAELASCVGKSVAADGRSLVADRVEERSFYGVRRDVVPADASDATPGGDETAGQPAAPTPVPTPAPETSEHVRDEVWFALASADTLTVATSKEFLRRSLSESGEKVGSSSTMAGLLERVDRKAGIWFAGEMDPIIGKGLVAQSAGRVAAPPTAMFGSVSLSSGIDLVLGVDMATEDDANGLESLISGQKGLWALAAQQFGLGAWIDKLGVDVEARTVYLRVSLNQDEVREILARIDTSAGSEQNSADTEGGP